MVSRKDMPDMKHWLTQRVFDAMVCNVSQNEGWLLTVTAVLMHNCLVNQATQLDLNKRVLIQVLEELLIHIVHNTLQHFVTTCCTNQQICAVVGQLVVRHAFSLCQAVMPACAICLLTLQLYFKTWLCQRCVFGWVSDNCYG